MTDAHSAFDRDSVDDMQSHDAPLPDPFAATNGDGGAAPPPPPTPSSEEEGALSSTRAVPGQATSAVAFVAPVPGEDDPLLAFEPYLHSHPRKRSITPDVQRAFVAQLAATGIVKQAARHVGRSIEALYRLRHRPGAEGFSAAWDAALDRGVRRLEDCALERAIQGTSTPIVSGGKILGWYDKPDNNLLRFLLQYRLPERYGVQTLKPGNPVYESIRKSVMAELAEEEAADEQRVFAEIDEMIDRMKRRSEAAAQRNGGSDDGAPAQLSPGGNHAPTPAR